MGIVGMANVGINLHYKTKENQPHLILYVN